MVSRARTNRGRECPLTGDEQATHDITRAKQLLRRTVLAGRADLPDGVLAAAGQAIARALLGLPSVQGAQVVAAYAALPGELPTWQLIDALVERGATVLLPTLEAGAALTWRAYAGQDSLSSGRYGLLEPAPDAAAYPLAAADVVVLPGLCYDGRGNRLGRGGGSYDRAIEDVSVQAVTIGIALDHDVIDVVPVESHDRRVKMIVTPTRVIAIEDGGP